MIPRSRLHRLRPRRGFSLAEVLVALTISGIVGIAMTKVLRSQNQFFDQQTNQRTARSISRSSMNVMLNDLRMVQDSGGVDSVASNGKLIRVLVPYRFGLVCATAGNTTTVSMLPTDSGTVATSVYGGFAYRNAATGRYVYITPNNPTSTDAPTTSLAPTLCTGTLTTQAQVKTMAVSGRTGDILTLTAPAAITATVAAPVFFWQKVTYSFASSTMYPGKLGLWRKVSGGLNEELLAPFDTSARFKFYISGADASTVTPPDKNDIRGLDIVLNSMSPKASSLKNSTNSITKMTTSVFFKNVRSF